jgi:peptidoglycan/LPS O-acetylase OafA/YrhL
LTALPSTLPPDSGSPARIQSLQVLRAVAAWMVVFTHFDWRASSVVGPFLQRYGIFGVNIFFVISGFVMYHTTHGREVTARRFLSSRFVRIVPSYWLATLVFIPLKEALPHGWDYTDWTWRSVLASLAFLPNQNPSGAAGNLPFLTVGWTLNVEMFFYALLGVCFAASRRWCYVLCSVVLIVVTLFFPRQAPYGDILSFRRVDEFVLGMAIAFAYHRWPHARSWLQVRGWTAASLLGGALLLLTLDRFAMRSVAAGLVIVAALILEPRLIERRSHRVARAAVYLGTVSYSTYVWHQMIHGVRLGIFGYATSGAREALDLVVSVLLIVLASHLTFRLIENNPVWARLRLKLEGGEASPRERLGPVTSS